MTAAFLLMSSAALAGADVSPPPAAPTIITVGGCSNCSTPAPAPCGCEAPKKVGLLDKLKGKFGKKSSDCGCAPVPACAPVAPPPPAACNTCNTCAAAPKPNLFDKMKHRCGHKKADACGPACDTCGAAHLGGGCATPGAPYVPPTTGTTPPPKEMPKPKEEKPKTGTSSSVPAPLPPVNGAGGLTGSGSPY